MNESLFLDRTADINDRKRDLPHWHQDGKLQFVTFRLADSLPQEKLKRLHKEKLRWLSLNPTPLSAEQEKEYNAKFGNRIARWLDAGYGSCILRYPTMYQIVQTALCHFDGVRYLLHSYVVMPNHVHVLYETLAGYTTAQITHTWKSYTAHEINKRGGTTGEVWSHESYDRMIRDEVHYARVMQYIEKNRLQSGCRC